MLCLIILSFKHENSFWLVLKCIHDLQKKKIQNKQTQKKQKEKKNYESRIKSRIKLIFFNFIFFTFQMNNIFNYLKKELIIQHVKYNYDR